MRKETCCFSTLVCCVDVVTVIGAGDDIEEDGTVKRVDGTVVEPPWPLAGYETTWKSFRRCPRDAVC